MEIVKLNRQQLDVFIHSDEYKTMPHVPISFHRGISHINNPRIHENDILLILVYEKELIGYLGIIPDLVYINKLPEKMGWMSCIWIHPNARGKGIAKLLTQTSIELYKNKIFCTEFTPEAETLYNKLKKFDPLVNKNGIRIYRRSCLQTVLPARRPSTTFLFPLLGFYDTTINLFHDFFLKKRFKHAYGYTIEYPLAPEESCFSLANNFQINELTQRKKEEFYWFYNYPWIKETKAPTEESRRYHFSSEARFFKTVTIKIRNENDVVAFLIVTIREKHMKTPYVYVRSGHEAIVSETLNNLMFDYKTEILTTYQKSIISQYKNCIGYLKSKSITRKYLQSKGFNLSATEIMLQDGDGDCGFV